MGMETTNAMDSSEQARQVAANRGAGLGEVGMGPPGDVLVFDGLPEAFDDRGRDALPARMTARGLSPPGGLCHPWLGVISRLAGTPMTPEEVNGRP